MHPPASLQELSETKSKNSGLAQNALPVWLKFPYAPTPYRTGTEAGAIKSPSACAFGNDTELNDYKKNIKNDHESKQYRFA